MSADLKQRGSLQLWQFLVYLLDYKKAHTIIQWTNRQNTEFKLVDPEEVARQWGSQKNRPTMTYAKLSRSLRYYYEKNIMQKVTGERYVYKFTCDINIQKSRSNTQTTTPPPPVITDHNINQIVEQILAPPTTTARRPQQQQKRKVTPKLKTQESIITNEYSSPRYSPYTTPQMSSYNNYYYNSSNYLPYQQQYNYSPPTYQQQQQQQEYYFYPSNSFNSSSYSSTTPSSSPIRYDQQSTNHYF